MLIWYALNTKPQCEARVYHLLVARGFEIYLPMLPTKADGRRRPLFPAYMFVRCDLLQVDVAKLQWVPGLRRIVGFAGRPARVPDDAIALIRTKLAEIEAQGGLPAHGFKPGERVVIEGGPLAGLDGIFVGPQGPAERVRILVNFLGEANRAEIPVELLRSATDEPLRRRGTRGQGRRIRYRS